MFKRFKQSRGFNLISLIVVMLVIAVLVGIAVPKYQGNIKAANRTKLLHDGRILQDACSLYNIDHVDSVKPWPILDKIFADDLPGSVVNLKGEKVELDSGNAYYLLDMTELTPYIGKNNIDSSLYILSESVGDIYLLGTDSAKGAPTENVFCSRDPEPGEIVIDTAEKLANIGVADDYPLNGRYIQTSNIDLQEYADNDEGAGWIPIGDSGNKFSGVFDGNGFVISNLVINRFNSENQGLFGCTSPDAELCNITLNNVEITANGDNIGGLIGSNEGIVEYCNSTVCITTFEYSCYVGGLIGKNRNDVKHCWASGSISGFCCDGGLIGDNDSADVISCYATCDVDGCMCIGGLVANNRDGNIGYCYSDGDVSGITCVGGLIGYSYSYCGKVFHSHSMGNVLGFASPIYGTGRYLGGLIGQSDAGSVEYCYSIGDVVYDSDEVGANVGGLIGFQYGATRHCYSIGDVKGGDIYTGGLIGESFYDLIFDEHFEVIGVTVVEHCYSIGSVKGNERVGGLTGSNNSAIFYCYCVGSVEGDVNTTGGFIGLHNGGGGCGNQYYCGDIESCYWNKDVSNQVVGIGGIFDDEGDCGAESNVHGKSTVEMKQKSTFEGWDFESVWGIDANKSYPYLRGNVQSPAPQ